MPVRRHNLMCLHMYCSSQHKCFSCPSALGPRIPILLQGAALYATALFYTHAWEATGILVLEPFSVDYQDRNPQALMCPSRLTSCRVFHVHNNDKASTGLADEGAFMHREERHLCECHACLHSCNFHGSWACYCQTSEGQELDDK